MKQKFTLAAFLLAGFCFFANISLQAQCTGTIANANFADAIRNLYPALIGPTGNNTLTAAAATYAGELDLSGWGNATNSANQTSAYAAKPKLTTIEGIQCFTNLTKLNVYNEALSAVPDLPATLTELRCVNNVIASLPATLPAGLRLLHCFSNQLTSIPTLPAGLVAFNCGQNRLTAIPDLPATLTYFLCQRQYTLAPTGTLTDANKTLAVLPALPAGLRAIFCDNNKLTSLPALPAALTFLNASGNPALTCIPILPSTFFSAGVPSGGYFTFGSSGGAGSLAEPRLVLTTTAVVCLPNLPTGFATNKINPSVLANNGSVCSTPPAITGVQVLCTPPGTTYGKAVVSATAPGSVLEYSIDATNFQASNTFSNLSDGPLTVSVRRQNGAACGSAVATQSITIPAAAPGYTGFTIADANFADAIRNLYPSLIGPAGDNRLTNAVDCFDNAVDFSGWGNATNSIGEVSAFAIKPKLTTVAGIGYFSEVLSMDVSSQAITQLNDLPVGLKTLKCQKNLIVSVAVLPATLDYLDCANNMLSTLPALPAVLQYFNCNTNKFSVLPDLPANLKFLRCDKQITKAPLEMANADVFDADKLLTALPVLPAGLLGISAVNNNILELPAFPSSFIFLDIGVNKNLKCLPQLPANFFNANLSTSYLAQFGVADARLRIRTTGINCLSNLPAGVTTAKVNPSFFGTSTALCATAPALTALVSGTTSGLDNGEVRLNAIISNTSFGLEYSKDGTAYQDSSLFQNLAAGSYTFYARRKQAVCQTATPATVAITLGGLAPATYYVSTTGNDGTGDGSIGNPYKTINYTITKVTANKGDTIKLAPGTYVEASIINLPSGVSLVGNGPQTDTIRVSSFYNMLANPLACGTATGYEVYKYRPDQFVMQLNGSDQLIKGFYLDGQSKACHGGIHALMANKVVIDNVDIRNFRFCGIWLPKSYNSVVKNSKIINSTWGNFRADFGNLMFYDCDNLRIHDNTIEVNDIGAYALKANSNFSNDCTVADPDAKSDFISKSFCNIKVYRNVLKVPGTGTWGNFVAPAITVEFPEATPREVEIYDNYINNHVSVPGIQTSGRDGFTYAGKTAHIHHNTFDMGIGAYRYAIEASSPNMEMNHNYIFGGLYPISCFISNNDNRFTNHKIHHNVFYAPTVGLPLLNYRTLPHEFKFYNNTVLELTGAGVDILSVSTNKPYYGTEFINNIFARVNPATAYRFDSSKMVAPVLRNNVFSNVYPFGANAVSTNNLFVATGDKPRPYFELQAGSPAIDAGMVITGITDGFAGVAPDAGAYEFTGGVLPLRLLKFTGKAEGKNSLLTWQTTAEINTSHTDVEYSYDGRSFSFAGKVNANTGAFNSYEFTHYNAGLSHDIVYYRLKLVDRDGRFEYSKLIAVRFGKLQPGEVNLYPNPVKAGGEISIRFEASTQEQAMLTIEAESGATVHRQTKNLIKGTNAFTVDVPANLAAGIYVLRLQTKSSVTAQKIIVQ